VAELREEAARACALTREQALDILARIARGEVARYLDEHGRVDPRAVKATGGPDVEAVEQYDGPESQTRKVKIRSPVQAIERLARMCGWDKQGPLDGQGITINLNIGEADDPE